MPPPPVDSGIPLVCRGCGIVQRVPRSRLRLGSSVACGACGRGFDVARLAAELPPQLLPEAGPRRRAHSEFP